ncbi:PKD domain-containing protein [Chitinophaga horti]|uniref:PKD domain-containing protein n=1 Tax=Chitinophaga horti TaxID=2920382 RepID=A0ABY6J1H0_9BACT|nr:PKD domain-containing protein [Chitinophaga horti]UYQ93513.1 PKD domain-containing protein [Chitinophaga horti]
MIAIAVKADHIIGGEMYYDFIRKVGANNEYRLTVKLFVRCDATDQQFDAAVDISIFDAGTKQLVANPKGVARTAVENYNTSDVDPCIVNPPNICYAIGYYTTTVSLPANTAGYTAAYQRCCRRTNLTNINAANNNVGATYSVFIPGNTYNFDTNNSAKFNKEKVVIVCANMPFIYDYAAFDADGDSLVYSFTAAYDGASRLDPKPITSATPPFHSVQYMGGFTAEQPLGAGVAINPETGVISGTAPGAGLYIVTVTAKEYRNGVYVGEHNKEFQFSITGCVKQVVAAMPDRYDDCDGLTINFVNNSTPNKPYYWDFGDGQSLSTNSQDPIPHTYATPGVYKVKLVVDRGSNCNDSAVTTVYAFPRLRLAFSVNGLCTSKESQFLNTTTNDIGSINYYKWDFGITSAANDTSRLQNPRFHYTTPGTYTTTLIVKTDQGCEQRLTQTYTIYDKPPIPVLTNDTLLCAKDSLQLYAASIMPGTYSWAPATYNILNPQTQSPTVFPKRDTTYKLTFTDNTGCVNEVDVKIDVRDTLRIKALPDSVVCTGDPITLRTISDGDYDYRWTDLNTNANVGNTANTVVTPTQTTAYHLHASLGTCFNDDTLQLRTVDPPLAYAGADTTICYGDKITLTASGGSSYQWVPTRWLNTPARAQTVAGPLDTMDYYVVVTDTLGCPKPIYDTVRINVVPPVPAFAGNDTIITRGQLFQLNATGGTRFQWSPTDGLNNPDINNPITNINRDFTYRVNVYTPEGCMGTDDIYVRFIEGPEIYVPTGFTPNGDGLNDVFRPLPVGMTLETFRIFNRWGQQIFQTNVYMKGWDGNRGGSPAEVGTYVWVVTGKDQTGKYVERKGTVTLLR